MSNTKKFIVCFEGDNQVTLEVDTEKLTPELATEINQFWSSASLRLSEQKNDVVEAVVRLFGAAAINFFMENGGLPGLSQSSSEKERLTREVLNEQYEGWPIFEEHWNSDR